MVTAIGSIAYDSDYTEMARRPLDADRCALIVVDIQEKLLPPIFQKDQLVRNSQLLIRACWHSHAGYRRSQSPHILRATAF
jgi:hypothetical protein